MPPPLNSPDDANKRAQPRGPAKPEQPLRATAHSAYEVAPGWTGTSLLWWALGGAGVLIIAVLVSLAVWAANEDDQNLSDVAGAQSQSVTIEDQGFTAQQAEIDIGDAVELTNVGSEDCPLATNGEPVTIIRAGDGYSWSSPDAGRYTLTCEGRSGQLQVTVSE